MVGHITSDGGVLLLQEAEERAKIIEQFTHCFDDYRDPARVEHTVRDLLAQRVFGIALGYEDLNDHDELRFDPLLATAVGKTDPKGLKRSRARDRGASLATSSTLNRVELSRPDDAASHRYKRVVLREEFVDQILLDVFVQSFDEPPKEVVLDFDATDDPLHGKQEGAFLPRLLRPLLFPAVVRILRSAVAGQLPAPEQHRCRQTCLGNLVVVDQAAATAVARCEAHRARRQRLLPLAHAQLVRAQ